MNNKSCVNLSYRLQTELKVMNKMHIPRGNIEKQLAWVDKYSPKERVYACGRCPSYGLCSFVARYGVSSNKLS